MFRGLFALLLAFSSAACGGSPAVPTSSPPPTLGLVAPATATPSAALATPTQLLPPTPTPTQRPTATPRPTPSRTAAPTASLRPTPAGSATAAAPSLPPFPVPTRAADRRVYDLAQVFRPATIARVEADAATMSDQVAVDVVVVTIVRGSGVTTAQAEADALAIMTAWMPAGPASDGLVILFDLDASKIHGQLQLYAGDAFALFRLTNAERQAIYDHDMLPRLKAGDLDGALLIAMDRIVPAVLGPLQSSGPSPSV